MNSPDKKINKTVKIREILNDHLTKGWVVVVGLQLANCSASYSYDKWYIDEWKHANILVWSNKEEKIEVIGEREEKSKRNNSDYYYSHIEKIFIAHHRLDSLKHTLFL